MATHSSGTVLRAASHIVVAGKRADQAPAFVGTAQYKGCGLIHFLKADSLKNSHGPLASDICVGAWVDPDQWGTTGQPGRV